MAVTSIFLQKSSLKTKFSPKRVEEEVKVLIIFSAVQLHSFQKNGHCWRSTHRQAHKLVKLQCEGHIFTVYLLDMIKMICYCDSPAIVQNLT